MTMTLQEAKKWVEYAYDTIGCSELIEDTTVIFSNRLSRSMGTAVWNGARHHGEIKLSRKIFDLADEQDQIATVIHEACHIADFHYGNFDRSTNHHGPTWQRLMIKCGVTPDRFHTVDISTVRRKRTRIKLVCSSCGEVSMITKHKWTKYGKTTQHLGCKICNGRSIEYLKSVKV